VDIVEITYQPVNGEEQSVPVDSQATLTYDLLCWSDFSGDGLVGMADFLSFAASLKATPASLNWESIHSRLDGDGDDLVGIGDFLLFSRYWGERCP
jgi:hypothetical protein